MGLIKFKKSEDIDLKEEMKKKRNILLFGKLQDDEIEDVLEAVLYMNNESQNEPINLFISSNGGDVDSGMALYDLMQWLPTPFHTIGMGVCASMAANSVSHNWHGSLRVDGCDPSHGWSKKIHFSALLGNAAPELGLLLG